TSGARDSDGTQITGGDLVHGRRQVVEQHFDLTGYGVNHSGTGALVRDVNHLGAGGMLEGFTEQVVDRARARAAIGVLAWICLQFLNHAFEVLCRELGVHHRSEEHTSELQSRENLVCRLLLENKKKHAMYE